MATKRLFWRVFFSTIVVMMIVTIALSFAFSRVCEQEIRTKLPVNAESVAAEQVEGINQRLNHLVWSTFFFGSLVAAAASWIVSSYITNVLQKLTQSANVIADQAPLQLVSHETPDELGDFVDAFNAMGKKLKLQFEELDQRAQALTENSERLSTVLGGMVEGVIAVDSQDKIIFANEAAFRMIEFEGRFVVGRPYWEVLRNSDVQKVVREVVSGHFQLRQEIVIPRSQAQIAFIASRLPGEPCPGVVLVLHDVTELRRLEKIRSEFVSNVGHELKTPLAAIQACTETLSNGAINDSEHAPHFLKQISDHSDRLHKLIIDLMELAKIESEEEVFHSEKIDIGIPIQEAIDEHQEIARSAGISLSYEPTIEELIVCADQDGIRTIVNNLLDNALKYTPEGGKVFVKWYQEDAKVIIKIKDTGIGIDPLHLERIFERFYRIDAARSRDAGGTGLGLAIVKHLCQFFSGTIAVMSDLNEGAEFTLAFPIFSDHPS